VYSWPFFDIKDIHDISERIHSVKGQRKRLYFGRY